MLLKYIFVVEEEDNPILASNLMWANVQCGRLPSFIKEILKSEEYIEG